AVDLAAGLLLIVQQNAAQARLRAYHRGRKSRRAGADHRNVVTFVERAGGHHVPYSRLPRCVSTRMPSRTGVRQACRLATPSIMTRQSKHTPIWQYGPRGAPDTALKRQAAWPAASSAAATLSPPRAGVATPLTTMVSARRLSVNRRNIEAPRRESAEPVVWRDTGIDPRRQRQRM